MSTIAKRVAVAAGYVGSTVMSGWCEKFVRTCFGFGQKYGSALQAWEDTKLRHKDIVNAPAGVPIFWNLHPKHALHKYGHVAISVGGGYCISTSVGSNKSIGKVGIAELTKAWGMSPLGWTEDYHGQRVWEPMAPAPAPSTTTNEEDEMKAFVFSSVGVNGEEHLYMAFPNAREYEHLDETRDVADYTKVLGEQGFDVKDWKNAKGTREVLNPDAFGKYVGHPNAKPRGAKRRD